MRPQPTDNTTFGYHTLLRACWMAGKLPTVKVGAYGFKLTKKTVSNEHILPASKGGTLKQGNILLANKYLNNLRGNEPIENYLTRSSLETYLDQFIDVVVKYKNRIFDGNKYRDDIHETMKNIDLKA